MLLLAQIEALVHTHTHTHVFPKQLYPGALTHTFLPPNLLTLDLSFSLCRAEKTRYYNLKVKPVCKSPPRSLLPPDVDVLFLLGTS